MIAPKSVATGGHDPSVLTCLPSACAPFRSRVNAPASSRGRAESTAAGGYDAALADEPSDLLGIRRGCCGAERCCDSPARPVTRPLRQPP